MNNSIDTKITMLYDFNYSKSFNNNIKSFNISIDDISLDDIKIKNSTSEEHTDILTELFNGKFKLITSDTTTLVLKRYTDSLSVSLHISPYETLDDIKNINSMNNNDSLFSYILSNLVLNNKLRHILLPIINIDVDFQQINDIIKPYENMYNEYMEMIESSQISNIFSIRVKESFFKCMTLKDYIESNQISIKKLLFQVIHTLAVLQREYKGFRHNLLNPSNIYIYQKKESDKSERYEYEDMNFYIVNNNIDIKITNFFAACIPNVHCSSASIPFIDNKKTNDYFDLHYFLNNLIDMIELSDDKMDETNVFLNKVIPKKYRSKKNHRYMEDFVELFKPSDLLTDEYFKEFTTKKETTEVSNNSYMTTRQVFYERDNVSTQVSKHNPTHNKVELKNKKTKKDILFELDETNSFMSLDSDEKVTKSRKNKETLKLDKKVSKSRKSKETSDEKIIETKNKYSFISLDSDEKIKKGKSKEMKGGGKYEQKDEMEGGGRFFKPPTQHIHNSPYVSNENRRIKGMEMPVKEDDKNITRPQTKAIAPPQVIASQEILINPLYKKPYKPFEKPTWDRNHVGFDKKYEVLENSEYKRPYGTTEYKPPYQTKSNIKLRGGANSEESSDSKPYKKPYENKSYENKSSDYKKPYENKSYENKSSDYKKPYENKSYENKSSDYKKPYENKSYENKSSDYKKPYENKSYENKSSDYKKPYEKSEYTEKRHIKPEESDEPSYRKPYETNDKYRKPYETNDKYRKPQYSDEEKKEYYRQKPNPVATESPLLAEQKIYQSAFSTAPVKHTDHTHPKYSNPAFLNVENNMMYPTSFVPGSAEYFPYMKPLQNINEIPLQNVYNINLGNPSVHSNNLSRIYEDALPGDPYSFTMKSVFERIHLINFMRNSMVKLHDGEEMTMQVGQNSFLEYIRLLEFNPFALGVNPYSTIPSNFLLYGGAYPVRYNMETRQIDIAKHGMAVCIRMYMMSVGAMNYNRLGAQITANHFDVWRELKYYKYVRETFLDKKICPNFISMILYKYDNVSNINYGNIYNIIGRYQGLPAQNRSIQLSRQINNAVQNEILGLNAVNPPIPGNLNNPPHLNNLNNTNLAQDSTYSMITLTESPTCNLIEWASPIYRANGVIKTMISTGYHSPDIWRSILFQLSYAMAVLQKHKIYFRNFTIQRNVFIKDLFVNTNIGYWIYKIDDVEYYVPNYGYIVVIDSSYDDIITAIPGTVGGLLPVIPPATPFINPVVIAVPAVAPLVAGALVPPIPITLALGGLPNPVVAAPQYLYKILSPELYTDVNNGMIGGPPVENNGADAPNIATRNNLLATDGIARGPCLQLNPYEYLIRHEFKRIMTRYDFTNTFPGLYSMERPDNNILDLIDKLHDIPDNIDYISKHLITCFPEYLHNKIGTFLTKTERDMLNPSIPPDFQNIKGKLIVYTERYDEYKWAIYIGPGPRAQQKEIFVKDANTGYGRKTVFLHSLVNFPDPDSVTQTADRPYKLTKDALIETYTFQ